MPGANEDEFRKFCNALNVRFEKKPDMRKCWRCGAPAFQKRTDDEEETNREGEIVTPGPKPSRPDFLMLIHGRYAWVECKSGHDSFAWASDENHGGKGIRTGQRLWLNREREDGIPCFLFISLGDGRAPEGRDAYMITWVRWLEVEKDLIKEDMKSISWMRNTRKTSIFNMRDEFDYTYRLKWKANVGWVLGPYHILVTMYGLPSLY